MRFEFTKADIIRDAKIEDYFIRRYAKMESDDELVKWIKETYDVKQEDIDHVLYCRDRHRKIKSGEMDYERTEKGDPICALDYFDDPWDFCDSRRVDTDKVWIKNG